MGSCNGKENKDNATFRRLTKVEVFNVENGSMLSAFLDRNGYTGREVRGIAGHAIALWETQKVL